MALKKHNSENNYTAGIVLITIGILIFLKQLGFSFPSFLFHWYMIPIAVGLYTGAKNNFNEPYGWVIPILIGGLFWANDVFPFYNLFKFIVPILLIGLGLMTILKNDKYKNFKNPSNSKNDYIPFTETTNNSAKQSSEYAPPAANTTSNSNTSSSNLFENTSNDSSTINHDFNTEAKTQSRTNTAPNEDFFNAFAIMSGINRNITSRNFKSGDVTAIMGGVDINLLQADFSGIATIHISQIMGGTSLKVPSTWTVRDEITSIMGGVEDSRNINGPQSFDTSKILILKGFNFMGGIEIKSY